MKSTADPTSTTGPDAATRDLCLRALADHAPDWDYWVGPDGIYRYVSAACEAVCGYPPEAFLEDPGLMERLVLPEDRAAWDAHLVATANTGVSHLPHQALELRIRTRENEVRWIEHRCRRVYDSDGTDLGWRGVNHDITAHQSAVAALARSEAHLQAVVRCAPVGIITVVARIFVEVNDRLCEMTGHTRESLLGQSTRILYVNDAEFERVGAAIYPRATQVSNAQVDARMRRRDGQLIDVVLSSAALDPADLSRGVVSTLLDVTQARRDQALMETRLSLTAGAAAADQDTLLRIGLSAAKRLTNSQAGYFHCIETLPHRQGLPQGHQTLEHPLVVQVERDGQLMAILAVAGKPGDYTAADRAAVTDIAAMVMERLDAVRAEQSLRQAARVFESTSEGVMVTDPRGHILAVNRAFTRITGYAESDVLGLTPRILRSGRHDRAFYQELWSALRDAGQWRGEIWNRRKDGEIYPEWLTISAVDDATGQTTHYVAVFSDVTQLKQSQERMDFLAHHDALTGLPNRILLQDRLGQAIRRAQRERGRLALLFVDLDRFKEVNDTLGHGVGDRLLEAVARRLGERLRGADTLSRLGGDEFLVLLDGNSSAAGAAAAAQACLDLLRPPIQIDSHEIHLSASIGISLYPADGMDAETLIRCADLAMYQAKEQGRGNYQFHAPEMSIAAQEHHALENALRGALPRGELGLLYQPQIDLTTGHLWGVEALARWTHPDLGAVAPERFIPVAERIGLIGELGEWVLTEACRQLVRWRTAGFAVPRIAVNVSIQQLARSNLLPTLQRCLVESGLAPEDLEVEITESVIVGDNARVITALSDLRSLGISLVVDDFGTGSCALGRINRVPIDRLKIHGSFIRCIGRGQSEEAITRAIIGLGRDLGLAVIAEGVEREDQSAFLQAAGCRLAQGYLFGAPMDADALGAYLGRTSVN